MRVEVLHALGAVEVVRSEESQLREEPRGVVDDASSPVDCVASLVRGGFVPWTPRVLQLVASAPQGTELPEDGAELSAHRLLDGVVAASGRRPQTLVRQQRGQSVTRSIVGEDERRVRVCLEDGPCAPQGGGSPRQERFTVGRPARQLLKIARLNHGLHQSFAQPSPDHQSSPSSPPITTVWAVLLIWPASASTGSRHSWGDRTTGFTSRPRRSWARSAAS